MKPNYYDKFRCTAERCGFTCCQQWKIAVDGETRVRWGKMESSLCNAVEEKEGEHIIALNENRRCPFLEETGLCGIVLRYGDEMLPETCDIFPREIHDFGAFREYALVSCCPAVIDLMYGEESIFLTDVRNAGDYGEQAVLFEVRRLMLDWMEREENSPNKNLLMIFYLLLDLYEKDELCLEQLSAYRGTGFWEELSAAVDGAAPDLLDSFTERNELFLDLSENYRREGLYREYLEEIGEVAGKFSERCDREKLCEALSQFEQAFLSYRKLIRRFLWSELYSETLPPGGDLEDMLIAVQWLAMEYAAIRHAVFCAWLGQREESGGQVPLPYETVRQYMTVVSRMTGYDDEDIRAYLENSFERLIWDWGYFALITY